MANFVHQLFLCYRSQIYNMNYNIFEDTQDYTNNTPSSEVCFGARHNKTIIIINSYEGIPETLILNLIAWVFLILLFTVLRQQAWDYGKRTHNTLVVNEN